MKNKKNAKKKVFRKQNKNVAKRQNTKNQKISLNQIDENKISLFFNDLHNIFRNSDSEKTAQINEQQQNEKIEDKIAANEKTSQTTQDQISTFSSI